MPYELGHFQLFVVGLLAPHHLPLSYESTCCQLMFPCSLLAHAAVLCIYLLPASSSVYLLPAPSALVVPRILPSPFAIMLQLSYGFTCCQLTCPLCSTHLFGFLSPHEQATSTPAARPYMTLFTLPVVHCFAYVLSPAFTLHCFVLSEW